jgi:hypothetical protein
MGIELVRDTPLSLVALDTTMNVPPLITECCIAHMDDGRVSAGPWTYWVQPDVSWLYIRPQAWPKVCLAPSWAEVAGRVVEAIGGRVMVMHSVSTYSVLRGHLPDWVPPRAVFTRAISRKTWTELEDYALPSRSGAGAALHALSLLVPALIAEAPVPSAMRGGGGPT